MPIASSKRDDEYFSVEVIVTVGSFLLLLLVGLFLTFAS